jgi:hypothetical protein
MDTTSSKPPENPYNTPIVRFGMYFFSAVLICSAPIAAYFAIARFLEARESLRWPTSEAVVVASEIEENRSIPKKPSFTPKVRFKYSVEGRELTGTAISNHDVGYGDRSNAQEIVDKYRVNSLHTAYYDPVNPKKAVLEPGLNWRAYLFLLIPLAFVLISIFLIVGVRQMKRQAKG